MENSTNPPCEQDYESDAEFHKALLKYAAEHPELLNTPAFGNTLRLLHKFWERNIGMTVEVSAPNGSEMKNCEETPPDSPLHQVIQSPIERLSDENSSGVHRGGHPVSEESSLLLGSSQSSLNRTPSEDTCQQGSEEEPSPRREMTGLTSAQVEQLREVLAQTEEQTRRKPHRGFFVSSCPRQHHKRLVLLFLILIATVIITGGEFQPIFVRF